MSGMDLDEHLAAIQSGDPVAFGRWIASTEPTLRLTLRSFAAVVDVEAILQETLLRVWQVAPRFLPDGEPNSLFRLTVRMARNLAVSELRRGGAHRLQELTDERADAIPALTVNPPDPLLRRRIEKCQNELPTKPGMALRARLASDGTEPDDVLAARLSMRVNTFLQNVTRARRLLEECLSLHGVDLTGELP